MLKNPKGRVPRAKPVGECCEGDMRLVKWMHGDKVIRAHGISHRISHSLDTEISPSHPESWRKRVLDEAFSEGNGANAGM